MAQPAPVTATQIRKIKSTVGKKAPDKYSDGEGLYLHVFASGGKRWIFDFRLDGKRKSLYPDISLKQAREAKDEARKLVAQGIDPTPHVKPQKK